MVLVTFSTALVSPVLALYKLDEASKNVSSHKLTHAANKLRSTKTKTAAYLTAYSVSQPNEQHKIFSTENKYQPYFKIGGARYFNQIAHFAGIYDLFIPLFQTEDSMLFTDLRIFDRRSGTFEGNAHLGYRKLFPEVNLKN
jgi:hypothetical protein